MPLLNNSLLKLGYDLANLSNIETSGAEVEYNFVSETLRNIISYTWWRQGRLIRLRPICFSKRTAAPVLIPVFEAVVSYDRQAAYLVNNIPFN